jgi:hypothetical protein
MRIRPCLATLANLASPTVHLADCPCCNTHFSHSPSRQRCASVPRRGGGVPHGLWDEWKRGERGEDVCCGPLSTPLNAPIGGCRMSRSIQEPSPTPTPPSPPQISRTSPRHTLSSQYLYSPLPHLLSSTSSPPHHSKAQPCPLLLPSAPSPAPRSPAPPPCAPWPRRRVSTPAITPPARTSH